jgi:hypothetical protein
MHVNTARALIRNARSKKKEPYAGHYRFGARINGYPAPRYTLFYEKAGSPL